MMLLIEYAGAFLLPALLPWLIGWHLLPCWVASSWVAGTLLCSVLWEIFVTFGLAGGLPVSKREPARYPILGGETMNWLLMSALDSSVVLHALMMGSAVLLCEPHDASIFHQWRFDVTSVMWVAGYAQGVLVALFHRHVNQKNKQPTLSGDNLSWFPSRRRCLSAGIRSCRCPSSSHARCAYSGRGCTCRWYGMRCLSTASSSGPSHTRSRPSP